MRAKVARHSVARHTCIVHIVFALKINFFNDFDFKKSKNIAFDIS